MLAESAEYVFIIEFTAIPHCISADLHIHELDPETRFAKLASVRCEPDGTSGARRRTKGLTPPRSPDGVSHRGERP